MHKRVWISACGFTVASFMAAAPTGPALANGFPEWCLDAIKAGDTAQATEYANMVLEGGRDFDPTTAEEAVQCVKQALGKDVVYDPVTFVFAPAEVLEARREASRQAAKAIAERRAKVVAKLHEGCAEIYRRDEAEAITTPACFDYFLEVGLPE